MLIITNYSTTTATYCYLPQDGDVVEKDKPYVEVEAMKMIMAIKGE